MNKSRFLNATAFGIAAFLIGAALRADLPKSGDDFILGPMRQIASVDNCGADEPGAWKSKSGVNVSYSVQSEYALPGVSTSLLRVFVGEKDAKDREPGHNWFVLSRERLPVFRASEPIDGFRFLLGSQTETQWWIQVELTDATGETYSHLLADHPFPSGKILEYAVPLDEFRAKSGAALCRSGRSRFVASPSSSPRRTPRSFSTGSPPTAAKSSVRGSISPRLIPPTICFYAPIR